MATAAAAAAPLVIPCRSSNANGLNMTSTADYYTEACVWRGAQVSRDFLGEALSFVADTGGEGGDQQPGIFDKLRAMWKIESCVRPPPATQHHPSPPPAT